MLLQAERELIVEHGIKMIESDLTKGTSGNISIFNKEKQLMAISPSGIDYFKIKSRDVMVLNLNGEIIEGDKKPSSEYALHRIFYKNRDDINAIVHTHSRYSATLACLNMDLPAVHYMLAVAGLDVKCAKYATFGTEKLAENAYEAMKDRRAVLLANHGLLTGGRDISHAFKIAEEVEYCAELYYRAKCIGNPVVIDEVEMKNVLERFKTYGSNK